MFGTMKKAMVVVALAGVSAVAPAVASADVWQRDSSPIVRPYAGAGHISGSLTLTLVATGTTTTCNVTANLDLTNPGGVAAGQVTSFTLSGCTTSAPGCTVTATANTTPPWTITTSGTNVTISGVNFTNTYGGGAGCALNGAVVNATGSVTGQAAAGSNAITFTNASGLTTPFGPATVNGSVLARSAATGGFPITLVP
jgi:hypothetical protein